MDDPLGLFDSDSTAFLDELGEPSVGANLMAGGMDIQQQQQAQQFPAQEQPGFQGEIAGQKIQQFSFDHDYGGGGGTPAAIGGSNIPGMQGNMPGIAANPQAVQMMSPNRAPQFGSPPPGGAPANVPQSPQTSGFNQYNMQQQPMNQNPMWNQSPNSQTNSFPPQQPPQGSQYMGHEYTAAGQPQQFGSPPPPRHHMQQAPAIQPQTAYPQTSQGMMQQQPPATAAAQQPNFQHQMQPGQINGSAGQIPQQNYNNYTQPQQGPQHINQNMMHAGGPHFQQAQQQQQQQGFPQQQAGGNMMPQQGYPANSTMNTSMASNVQNGPIHPQNLAIQIQQIQQQIQQLYNMQQNPETQQQMLDLQEKVRTLRAQQQQQIMQQQQQQTQQPQQQTFIITRPAMQQQQQQQQTPQQRPVTSIVIQRGQLRGLQPGQTIQVQRPGQQPQTIRIQQAPQQMMAGQQPQQQVHTIHLGQQQQMRPQISPNQQAQPVMIQQHQQRPRMVMQQQQQQVVQVQGGGNQIIRVQQPQQQQQQQQQGEQKGVLQVQTVGGSTTHLAQLASGQQVRLVQVSQSSQQSPQQQTNVPRVQLVTPNNRQQQQQPQQKLITVVVQKPPGSQQKSPPLSGGSSSISPVPGGQEIQVAVENANIPSTVASTEEVETSEATDTPSKPKKKRPAKKRTVEEEKSHQIIQEAIAKAKAEGREVPKVIETEDGQTIAVPQPKKKSSPKKKKSSGDAEKDEKPKKKAKEPKEPKPKPPPRARPPKKKKTIPTFLKNKKRSKKADSDEDVKITPPNSPMMDDALKRRSSRNTKRKKYLDELDLDISEDEKEDENTPLVKTKSDYVAEEETQIVEKIMASRLGKRPKPKALIQQIDEAAATPTTVVPADNETDENIDVDIEGDAPTATSIGKTTPKKIDAQSTEAKTTGEEELKIDVTSPVTTGAVKFLSPSAGKQEEEEEMDDVEEFYVKYKNFSYLHCEWKTAEELEYFDKRVQQKIKRYRTKGPGHNPFDSMEDEFFNPDYVEVDRVLEVSVVNDPATDEEVTYYLVKWRGLAYEDSTWELQQDVDKKKIEEFKKWRELPPEEEREYVHRPKPSEWKAYDDTPVYKNDNTLREYQLEGINWLRFCYHNKQNCILADEMGLGKTIQSITFLQEVYNVGIKGPYLVIVPLSTIGNWQREFEMWTDMNVIVYHGTQPSRNMLQQYEMYYRDENGKVIPDVYRFQALVTTYEVIIQDVELLSQIEWRICIIDEAHRLKNQKCKLTEGLKVIDLEHRVLLTGTPLQNNVEELYSLLKFLEPKQFHSLEAFMADFGDLKSESQVDKLKELLKPMMLRRLKEDVEKSLAPKEETIVEVELTNIQKKYYRAILERNFSFLAKQTGAGSVPSLMNTMMELRKCCNHPFLINGAEDQIMHEAQARPEGGMVNHMKAFQAMVQASGKLVLIDKLLPKLKAGDHKVLIFSQMIRVLDIIEDYLIHKHYLYERIDGRIRGNLRQEAIDRFSKKDSDRFVFLLCTRAGGLGINLTAADTVIIYDSDWNPQNDLQAQARCHRIGQQKAVKIYRLITRNSYEREMFDKASLKLGLDKAVLQSMGNDKNVTNPNQMSKKEIEELLKKGAYGALMDDDKDGDEFCEEDIDQILQRRTQVIAIEAGEKGSTFAKASFSVSSNRSDIDLNDPNFWQKWAKKADIDVDEIKGKNELIMELPRQRKQTARYTYNDAENEGMSEIESSEGDSDSEGGGKRGKKGERGLPGRRPGRRRREDDDDGPIDGPFDYYTRADCFKVEKSLLVYGWGRWDDILRHGKHRRKLQNDDCMTITRAMLFYALQQYAGDERIKGFIYDLIAPRKEGEEMDHRNHSGLSAPVPRGRKGKKVVRGPGPSLQDEEMASKMDLDPDSLLVDDGYKKHLKRHANKVLLRVRLLYYLRHEVIGDQADRIMSGTPAHEIPIPTPYADAEPPVYWWNMEADRSLLVGIFKHGFEKYNLMRADSALVFLSRCGPPDQALVNAEMNDEEIKNPSDDEGDTDFKPRKRGRPGRKKINAAAMDDDDESGMGTPSKQSPMKPVVQAEEGKHPWPSVSDLNTRLRRIITSYQRSKKHEQIKMDQMAKKNEKRQRFEQILQERERARVESRQRWVRREETEFYRVVSTFGVERDRQTGEYSWSTFRRLANMERKYDDTLTCYFHAFYHMCQLVCRRYPGAEEGQVAPPPPNDMLVEPITEERAARCLARIDLLNRIRETVLWHPKLEERLKLCQPSLDMPEWWVPGDYDKDLVIGAAKHGLSRTDYHIAFDPKLVFKEIINKKQAALVAASAASSLASSPLVKSGADDVKPTLTDSAASTPVKTNPADLETKVIKAEVKAEGEVKQEVKDEEMKTEDEEEQEVKDIKNEVKSELNGEDKSQKSAEERTDVDTEEEELGIKPLHKTFTKLQEMEEDTNMSTENGANDSGSEMTSKHVPAVSIYWPKDRVMQQRLEQVCYCVENGEWSTRRSSSYPPRLETSSLSADSRSSTPLTLTHPGGLKQPGSGDYTIHMPDGSSSNATDGLKLTFSKKKRGRRSRAEIEAERNHRLRELMGQHAAGMITLSDAESESNMSGYGLENGSALDSSPLRGAGGEDSGDPGEFLLKKKRGRKRKMDKFLEAAAAANAVNSDGSPAPSFKRQAWSPSRFDPDVHVTVVSVEDGTRLAGEDAPKRKDLEAWLLKHPSYTVENPADIMLMDDQDDEDSLPPGMSLTPGRPGRRRTRIDPTKLELSDVTGEENVAVVNRETGKRITGAKAPPLKHLTQWLEKNPGFDVDPKWAHIVKAKGKVPEDMHHRILIPHGRGRRPTSMPSNHAQLLQQQQAAAAAASSPEYYAALSQLAAAGGGGAGTNSDYAKYIAAATAAAAGGSSGAGAYGALASVNPMYAAAIQQYQSMMTAAMAAQGSSSASKKESAASSSKEKDEEASSTKKKEEEAAEALSSMTQHSAFPFMSYNPMMMSQLYAQSIASSQYASSIATLMQNGSLDKAAAEESIAATAASSSKKHRVRDNALDKAKATPASSTSSSSTTTSSQVRSSKPPDSNNVGMDLTVKKATQSQPPSAPKPSPSDSKSPAKAKKGFTLENIVHDLSLKKVKPQDGGEEKEST